MTMKQRLFSNMFLRNMLADFGSRSAGAITSGNFTPYFQYRISQYQPDYYLYFPKKPYAIRYKNEAFNKLQEYTGYDLIQYLDFHYTAYHDKADFLRFLQYEISDRLKRKCRETFRKRLQLSLDWVGEKQLELQASQEAEIKKEIEQDLQGITGQQASHPEQADFLTNEIAQKMTSLIEKLREAYITGNIRVNQHKHLQSLIQLFYILQTLQFTDETNKIKQRLFTNFATTDLASLLRLHFSDYRDKQLNTIQKEIAAVNRDFDANSERFRKMDKSLQEFFFAS